MVVEKRVTDGRTDRRTDGPTDGRMDGRTDGPTAGRTESLVELLLATTKAKGERQLPKGKRKEQRKMVKEVRGKGRS